MKALGTLQTDIKKLYSKVRLTEHHRRLLPDQITALANLLSEAKDKIAHGGWIPWIEQIMSRQQANKYLLIHKAVGHGMVVEKGSFNEIYGQASEFLNPKPRNKAKKDGDDDEEDEEPYPDIDDFPDVAWFVCPCGQEVMVFSTSLSAICLKCSGQFTKKND